MPEIKLSLYQKIYLHFKDEITSGRLTAGSQLPTESQLMADFNVSRITAKRALDELESDGFISRRRGSGSYVNNITHHFTDNEKNIHQIAFVIPSDEDAGPFMYFMSGAAEILSAKNYQIVFYNSGLSKSAEHEALFKAEHDGCDGIIYYPGPFKAEQTILSQIATGNFPIVVLDKSPDGLPITCVVSDNVGGAHSLMNHLLDKGHRKFAFIANGKELSDTTGERYLGLCSALSSKGFPLDNIIYRYFFDSYEDIFEHINCYEQTAIERLTSIIKELKESGVTAICTLNDSTAMLVYKAVARLGLSIPKDIAVTGFDDLDYAKYASPPLTTVKQNFHEMGRLAAEEILRLIETPDHRAVKRVVPTSIVSRHSV